VCVQLVDASANNIEFTLTVQITIFHYIFCKNYFTLKYFVHINRINLLKQDLDMSPKMKTQFYYILKIFMNTTFYIHM